MLPISISDSFCPLSLRRVQEKVMHSEVCCCRALSILTQLWMSLPYKSEVCPGGLRHEGKEEGDFFMHIGKHLQHKLEG